MIEYQITIERREGNPLFRRTDSPFTPMYNSEEMARLTLTEAEYQAVKEALLEHWATKIPPVTLHD